MAVSSLVTHSPETRMGGGREPRRRRREGAALLRTLSQRSQLKEPRSFGDRAERSGPRSQKVGVVEDRPAARSELLTPKTRGGGRSGRDS